MLDIIFYIEVVEYNLRSVCDPGFQTHDSTCTCKIGILVNQLSSLSVLKVLIDLKLSIANFVLLLNSLNTRWIEKITFSSYVIDFG